MDIYHVSADMYSLMKLLHITIKSPQDRTFVEAHIVAEDNVVTLTLEEQSEDIKHFKSKLVFEEMKFSPQSFSVCQINACQFSFQLQMYASHQSKDKLQKSYAVHSSNQHESWKLILSEEFICTCAICSQALFHSNQFDEVLPAGNYSEIAESSWCLCRCRSGPKRHQIESFSGKYDKHMTLKEEGCHDHSQPSQQINVDKKFVFVSETSLMFEDDFDGNVQLLNDGGSIVCPKCNTILGVSSKNLTNGYKRKADSALKQLHLHSLSFTFPQSSFQMWPSNEDELQIKMSNLLTSGNVVGTRFVVEVRNEGNKLIPLVLMTLLSTNDVIYSLTCAEFEEEHHLEAINVVKFLAKHCTTVEDDKMGKEWLKDFSVENIEIPKWQSSTFVEMIRNNRILSGDEGIDGFGVSYLRRESIPL